MCEVEEQTDAVCYSAGNFIFVLDQKNQCTHIVQYDISCSVSRHHQLYRVPATVVICLHCQSGGLVLRRVYLAHHSTSLTKSRRKVQRLKPLAFSVLLAQQQLDPSSD